jgi:hypothetical protein
MYSILGCICYEFLGIAVLDKRPEYEIEKVIEMRFQILPFLQQVIAMTKAMVQSYTFIP